LAEKIIAELKNVRGVKKIVYAGSLRRMQETIGDLDLLAISNNPGLIMDAFVKLPEVEAVHSRGKTLSSVRLKNGRDADLRVLPPESFGAALIYFTGNKNHNIEIRKTAIKKGYKLNEYGLFRGKKIITTETEEEIYKKLGMVTPPPELRTSSGEIEAAKTGKLPKLVGYGDIRGDLQMHTDWTDGGATMEQMAEAARKLGYEYIAITDHTKALAMTGGLDETELVKHGKTIDRLNSQFLIQNSKFKILKSAELNILRDGSLDIKNEVLKKLDIVSAAVHTNFNMSRAEMTERIIKAMRNPHLNILFHPTGRILGRRDGYQIDIDAIVAAAKKYGVVLEIDAYPNRLDLKDEYVRKCVASGVKLIIDTDSHAPEHLQFMKYGIAQARRGWATKSDILNTLSAEKLLKKLKDLKKNSRD
jgi:DNA polymerase (family 10)